MKVKDLKKLVNELPENMTQEQFDNLTVMFSSDGTFHIPAEEESGVTIFGEPCNEQGEPIDDGFTEKDLTFFCLITKDLVEE